MFAVLSICVFTRACVCRFASRVLSGLIVSLAIARITRCKSGLRYHTRKRIQFLAYTERDSSVDSLLKETLLVVTRHLPSLAGASLRGSPFLG